MTKYTVVQSAPRELMHDFFTTQHPVVVCLTTSTFIAVALMTFAFLVKDYQLKSPDAMEEWSIFLEKFRELDFCVQNSNDSSVTTPTAMVDDLSELSTALPSVETTRKQIEHYNCKKIFQDNPMQKRSEEAMLVASISFLDVLENKQDYLNLSVSMMLAVHPTPEFVSIPHNLTYLTGFINGSDLGLKGSERIEISVQLPVEWNNTACALRGHCKIIHIYTCVYIQAPVSVFPNDRNPPVCETVNNTGQEYHTTFHAHNTKAFPENEICRSKTVINIQYKVDQTLAILMSLSDRSLINLHLLHTSYFLFIMTISILVYSTIRVRLIRTRRLVQHESSPMSTTSM